MSGMVMIKSGSESELHAAVAYVGPVAVAVDARSNGFRVCTSSPTFNCFIMTIYGKVDSGIVSVSCQEHHQRKRKLYK